MNLQMSPFVLSAIEEALFTPRQLFHTKVQFMSLAPAEKKGDLIWSFVPTKMTVENDEASAITVAAGGSGLDLGALRKLFHGRSVWLLLRRFGAATLPL